MSIQNPCKTAVILEPKRNSSLIHRLRIHELEREPFNPVSAVANLLQKDTATVNKIYNTITIKATNLSKHKKQFKNLQKIKYENKNTESKKKDFSVADGPLEEVEGNLDNLNTRAKKSVNKDWLKKQDLRPDFELFNLINREVDTISLPYPTNTENDLLYFKPNLQFSSLELNFDDVERNFFYNKEVEWTEFS
ncbi:hypothetical protein HDU92_006006 [Lobulomyces angularis]|nr:hypothetical protein HDU92_006006 [Lobulomyces angularis]